MIYWLTGQPSHGKTVLSKLLKEKLDEKNYKVFHIDGDDIRTLFTNNDYSIVGRVNNIIAAQKISHYLHNQGYIVIVSLVSPYIDQREDFKKLLDKNIIEFYVHCEIERERDHFKSIAYNKPISNFIDIDTTSDTPEQSLNKILKAISYEEL